MAHAPPSPLSPLPPWHFPFGPSTRYHQRERDKATSLHTRVKSAYTPTAPSLSTERRAHRRTLSSANVVTSPTASGNSATVRRRLSRHSSYNTTATSSSARSSVDHLPMTPSKSARRSLLLQDSPFSDYFTDESARSVHDDVPSSETQQLLVRILKLQSHLMRGETQSNHDAIRIIDRKLGEMEAELNGSRAQSRNERHLADSGVFTGDEAEMEDIQEDAPLGGTAANQTVHSTELNTSNQELDIERRQLHNEMHQLLMTLTSLQTELRQRHAEVRELNARHRAKLEERDEQIEGLRMENEGLRSDLGFEYSELLFLKLQVKALEVQVGGLDGDDEHVDMFDDDKTAVRQAKGRKDRVRRNRILHEIEGWRADWQDVNARFRRRRSQYGPLSPDRKKSNESVTKREDDKGEDSFDEGADWRLETTNEGKGRIKSLTIRRVDNRPRPHDEEDDVDDVFIDSERRKGTQTRMKREFIEHGTQTEAGGGWGMVPLLTMDPDFQDDCAVTSSSETELSGDEERTPAPVVERKTAWEELCESLANFAGMGEARF